jgi:Icc-related predicted phosphoesterase
MIIDCIGCLHGAKPELEGGDLLIVTGDLTARDSYEQYFDFFKWIANTRYKKRIVIAGNHDNLAETQEILTIPNADFDYLCDSGTEFEGLKIWGSPWTASFKGINPKCCAFTMPFGCDTEEHLMDQWKLIPNDTDILITHSPSFGNYDWIKNPDGSIGPSVGSVSLWMRCLEIKPKLHVFSHIHEAYGNCVHHNGIRLVNCSIMNEKYKPVNKPVRIVL